MHEVHVVGFKAQLKHGYTHDAHILFPSTIEETSGEGQTVTQEPELK
jgi:hypothetical protein